MDEYELLVIGSGPAGQKAAIQAAKLGRRVLSSSGASSAASRSTRARSPRRRFREAIVYLTGLSQRTAYGQSYRVKEEITIEDLRLRTQQVIEREVDIVRH